MYHISISNLQAYATTHREQNKAKMAKLRKDLHKVATRLDKIAKSDVKFLTDVKPKAEEDFDSELFE